ncbi:GlmU family protein [Belliella kenyensis]|uniref:GlmU family protein n=1 Tax=Belliella kenyensis TaxID=1472724 RepID=A0ABV8EJD1_9BACT|nr:GlmU family protein [Belliella kenyensis]MCH7401014.1 GlmU family protein [Belliella kenyensis]MDN3604012.1 GlmU family protein [Belliella kenyensis]
MDNLILFDDPAIRGSLLPFTFTRPVAAIRVGIMTISEKWEKITNSTIGYFTQDYLASKYPHDSQPSIMVNGSLCPNQELWDTISRLEPSQALWAGNLLIATHCESPASFTIEWAKSKESLSFSGEVRSIQKIWNIFEFNSSEIKADFSRITSGRTSIGIEDKHTVIYGEDQIFVEPGAKIKAAVLNAENGPIYIGRNSEIQEGALIRGPFALCEGSTVNMGAKMRGDTTIGPHSKVGGEVSNSVIFGYSNKGHDGFMGNSVLGEWCNLGADTNTSNLKNNYADVKVWDYTKGGFSNTGLQFCGLMMGDHSKSGINTMFNTGTVIGVGANVFGDGYPRNFVPSFSWGGAAGFSTFQLRKFEEVAIAVMGRRNKEYNNIEKDIIQRVFELTKHYRIWDKSI